MRTATLCLLGALIAAPAAAQDRPVHISLGGGPTFAFGDVAERFNTGWGPAIGVTLDVDLRLSLQFEYAYRFFSLKDERDVAAGVLDANHQTHQLALNAIVNLTGIDSPARVYVIGGPGVYYRKVEITQYEGTGVICDPWMYICGIYPVDSILASRGGWDFGFSAGGGVGFRFSDGGEFFIESRYHFVWGPEIEADVPVPPAVGEPGRSNGRYLPLTFGVRF